MGVRQPSILPAWADPDLTHGEIPGRMEAHGAIRLVAQSGREARVS